jgi:hypothetical protein
MCALPITITVFALIVIYIPQATGGSVAIITAIAGVIAGFIQLGLRKVFFSLAGIED